MSPRKSRLAVGLGRALFGCIAVAASPLAFAQSASTQVDATQLDTITVTAQSREQECSTCRSRCRSSPNS